MQEQIAFRWDNVCIRPTDFVGF